MKIILKRLGIIAVAALMTGPIGTTFNVNKAKADSLSFDVQPLGNSYKKIGYFKFNAKQNQRLELPIKIKNLSNHTISIDIQKLNALTSVYGNTQYVKDAQVGNSKLIDNKYAMVNYLKGPTSVTLESGQTKKIDYEFVSPKSVNNGTLLGGISFKEHSDLNNKINKGKIVITNQVERVIGVEGDYTKRPVNILVNKPSVKTTPSSPYIEIPLRNPTPMIATNIKLDYSVYKDGQFFFKGTTGNFKMAPMTEISYPANWNYKTYEPGKYSVNIELHVGDKTITQNNFSLQIKKKNVMDYQKFTGKITKPVPVMVSNGNNIILFLSLGLGIVIGAEIVIVFLVFRRKDKNKFIDSNLKSS